MEEILVVSLQLTQVVVLEVMSSCFGHRVILQIQSEIFKIKRLLQSETTALVSLALIMKLAYFIPVCI